MRLSEQAGEGRELSWAEIVAKLATVLVVEVGLLRGNKGRAQSPCAVDQHARHPIYLGALYVTPILGAPWLASSTGRIFAPVV
jgi:hypothetical protein